MKGGRSQYSIEFLITYGWALLIIGIIIGAIYTFGWFDPANFLPQKCSFYGQVGCKDFYLSKDSFNVSIINNFGVNLKVKGLDLFLDGKLITDSSDWTDFEIISWGRGDIVKVGVEIEDDSKIIVGQRANVVAVLKYFSDNTCPSCINNKIGSGCDALCVHNATGNVLVKVAR